MSQTKYARHTYISLSHQKLKFQQISIVRPDTLNILVSVCTPCLMKKQLERDAV